MKPAAEVFDPRIVAIATSAPPLTAEQSATIAAFGKAIATARQDEATQRRSKSTRARRAA